MNARNRVFMILGLLTVGSLIWYLVTTHSSGDLHLIGMVDANEVLVSARIPGRIQTLTVQEGEAVTAGQLIATIESDDLAAAHAAAQASVASQQQKVSETMETLRQDQGETSSQTVNAQAQVVVAKGALAQVEAQLAHQQADTQRTVALAKQGIMSAQASEEAEASLQVYQAGVNSAKASIAAAEAALRVRSFSSTVGRLERIKDKSSIAFHSIRCGEKRRLRRCPASEGKRMGLRDRSCNSLNRNRKRCTLLA